MLSSPYHAAARQPAPNLSGLAPLASPGFSGQVSLPAASAAAPALIPAGDSDTGLFAPAANSLALATAGQQRLTIDATGRILINTPASLPGAFGAAARLQLVQDGNPGATFWRFNAADIGGPYLFFERSRGGTVGNNTAVQSGDQLGQLAFNGADGTGYYRAATIMAEVDGAPSTAAMPGRLVISTTPSGGGGLVERLRVAADGNVTLGCPPGTESLRVVPVTAGVNRMEVSGAAIGGSPSLATAGGEANIDLALAPKGGGRVRFGSYEATAGLTPSGFIEIKDSGGTLRRLLVG